MDWKEILHIWLSDNLSINIEIGISLIAILVILAGLIFLFRGSMNRNLFFGETELNISLGGIGNVKLKSSHEVAQIAHKAWSELITRKAGLQFEPDHDVIVEVYNSWYQLFVEMRLLVKEIPAKHLKKDGTKKLVNILIDSLNKGMRPHLTKWQAKFRRWYEIELRKNIDNDKTPQEIQRQYPFYNDMVQDLILVNQQLVTYTAEIKKLIS
jgi:hypothetical protein